jgi:hypothetical protein
VGISVCSLLCRRMHQGQHGGKPCQAVPRKNPHQSSMQALLARNSMILPEVMACVGQCAWTGWSPTFVALRTQVFGSSPSQHYTPGPSSPSAIYHCYPGAPHHSLCQALAFLSTHTPHPLHLPRSGLPRLSSLCPATTITPFALLTCSASTTANLVAFLSLARVCALPSI